MSEQSAIARYTAHLCEVARTRPTNEAVQILKGALLTSSEESADMGDVRAAYHALVQAVAQFKAIEERQLKLL
jgi:hypothetical protein